MFLPILFCAIQASLKICICNNECHADCPANQFNATSTTVFNKYLLSQARGEKEIELFLYSKQSGFIFPIDQALTEKYNISVQTLQASQSVNVKINRGYFKQHKTIEIKPNYKITLPKLEPYLSKYNPSKMNALESSSSVSKTVPISIGMSCMKFTGKIQCTNESGPPFFLTGNEDEKTFGCEYQDLDSPSAYQCGLRCWVRRDSLGGTLEYTFKGVQFELFGTTDPEHDIINLNLDGKNIQIYENGTRKYYVSIYKSELLDYKEHTINISSKGVYELYKLVYWPSLTAKRLNVSDVVQTSGTWQTESDGIGGNRNYTNIDGTIIIPMHCKKFWLYGLKSNENDYRGRKIKIQYGDVSKDVSIEADGRYEQALLYESEDIEDYHFNLRVTGKFMFNYIFYEDFPTPISIGLSLMDIEGVFKCYHRGVGGDSNKVLLNSLSLGSFNCNYQNLDSIDAYQCGLRCWTDGDNDKSKCHLGYTFKGVKFALYGTFDHNHGSFDVFIDGKHVDVVNERTNNRLEYSV